MKTKVRVFGRYTLATLIALVAGPLYGAFSFISRSVRLLSGRKPMPKFHWNHLLVYIPLGWPFACLPFIPKYAGALQMLAMSRGMKGPRGNEPTEAEMNAFGRVPAVRDWQVQDGKS